MPNTLMLSRFIEYLRDVRVELTHVSWPTQKQAVVFTLLVVLVSAITAAFLGLFDYVFVEGLQLFI